MFNFISNLFIWEVQLWERESDRDRFIFHPRFTLQITTTARVGPRQRQEPGFSSGSLVWVLRSMHLCRLLLLLAYREQGAGSEVECLGLAKVPMCVAGAIDWGLTLCYSDFSYFNIYVSDCVWFWITAFNIKSSCVIRSITVYYHVCTLIS